MDQESRRKGPRSPSADSEESSHRRRARKYDRSPSPRRSRYRRSRSRDRRSRSSSRDRRRKESGRNQEWKQPIPITPSQNPSAASNPSTGYAPPVHNQYQAPPPPNTSQPPPPLPAYNAGYNYNNYNYSQGYDYSYQQPAANYRSGYPPPNWQGNQVQYNSQQAPPLPALTPQPDASRSVDPGQSGLPPPPLPRPEDAKKEAIAAEVKQQKATLAKQREEYIRKSTTLQRELEILRQQCDEIEQEGGRENTRIVKENQKLQIEIQNKMKSIHNVIDMLTGIIGDKATVEDLKSKYKLEINKRSRSPKEDFPKGKSQTPDRSSASDSDKDSKGERDKRSSEDTRPMYNFVHYDPEMHWCKVCDIFPKTAKEYLNHLHTNEHKEACLDRKIVDMPWHERNGEGTEKEVPYYSGLPTKRTPIKGLQFFSAATAWYCKLCDSWIGDLHCASLHLKSKRHSENFSRFVEQNPHWETDWMADREKAFSEERHKQIQLELQKQKEDEPPQKSKKSKKNKKKSKKSKKRRNRSSASDTSTDSDNTADTDSDQDVSKSIRVAMRNKMKASTQAILNEEIDYHGIKLKGHWAQVAQQVKQTTPEISQESDKRQLLNSIRDKLKAKQEEEMKERRHSEDQAMMQVEEEEEAAGNSFPKKPDGLEAWGPKEPPKPFWIKKEETEKPQAPPGKQIEIPKPEEMPKPHMGFWTKQQVNMTAVKQPPDNKSGEKEEERERDNRDRGERDRDRDRDRYKEDRERKYDRREEKYERYERYDRKRGRDRGGDYYDDRRKRDSGESPRRDRNWRDSPKGNYERYPKEKREENNSSNDESKFEKKTNESASKFKKGGAQTKKPTPQVTKGKLPFIGRLPLFKKKAEEPKPEKDIAPLPYQQSKFEDTPKVPNEIINPPGVVHITKLATPVNLNAGVNNNGNQATKAQAMKILVAPPPPVLNEVKPPPPPPPPPQPQPQQQVVDMEIEDQSEDVLIEEPMVEQQKQTESVVAKLPLPSHPPPPLNRPPPSFTPSQQTQPQVPTGPPFTPNRPPPFIPNTPPPFIQNTPRFNQSVRPPVVQNHPPPFVASLPPPVVQASPRYSNPPPPLPTAAEPSHDVAEIPEPVEKRPDSSIPLPDDLQEALNIIFPKEETETKQQQQQQQQQLQVQHQEDSSVMYASMYSMLGCVGYGPEYMDQPPPEITQAESEADTQPGPDDLRMLGIDEGDTIL